MMKAAIAVVVVAVAAMAAAHPSSQDRYVENPKTANQVLDNIVEKAVEKIIAAGWGESKNSQNGEATLPMHEESGTNETFGVSDVTIKGLGSLTRSKSASFNSAKTQLSGTVMLENASITAAYTAEFPGVDEAPSQSVSGTVTETVDKLFADIVININSDLTPLSIKSWTVRSGHDGVSVTGVADDNAMKPLHYAGFRKALRQTLENTMDGNMKVKVNQAIQEIKAEASS